MVLAETLNTLLARRDLPASDATALMRAIIAGELSPAGIAAIAVALRAKGESVDELTAFARVMRESSIAVAAPGGTLDTCGTGGDGSDTFNISTAAALVAAGMGIPIAKHGGRSATSKCGSADVLKALGVNIEANAACVSACIEKAGIGFMFAQSHHPGMKHVAPVRREMGVRTVFNLLGPLSNPAGAKLQLLGVFEPALCEKFAAVLRNLGSTSAMVVCGAGGGNCDHLDELSTFGPTTVARLERGEIRMELVDPATLGLPRSAPEDLRVSDAASSAAMIRAMLDGKKGAPRDIVVLNAAAAAIVAGKAAQWPEALALAAGSIDSGRARQALANLVQYSQVTT
jgi:anthranilate phosphoribosyltransferase